MASTSSLLNLLSPLFPSSTTITTSNNNTPKLSMSPAASQTSQQQIMKPISVKNDELYQSDVMAVVCPSLAYSNTLFFSASFNVEILVEENEPEEKLLNRFRREVMRAGVIQECRRRRHFENTHDKVKRKTREAAKRNSRRRRGPQPRFESKEEAPKAEKNEDDGDGDNWEMPEDNSPF